MEKVEAITGPALKTIRRKAGLSQTQMGELVGCSRHRISRYETKQRQFRPLEYRWGLLARILDVLDVQVLPQSEISLRARGWGLTRTWITARPS
ncbi:helix-turn-helix domain-containing protein [Roseovarius sp. 2305UL8-3]|uniref:helix-turn-helix domain-containing protein n=1 Tax=Roseovarius conchicola TaxID=3121636 RepID=UPI0035273454